MYALSVVRCLFSSQTLALAMRYDRSWFSTIQWMMMCNVLALGRLQALALPIHRANSSQHTNIQLITESLLLVEVAAPSSRHGLNAENVETHSQCLEWRSQWDCGQHPTHLQRNRVSHSRSNTSIQLKHPHAVNTGFKLLQILEMLEETKV